MGFALALGGACSILMVLDQFFQTVSDSAGSLCTPRCLFGTRTLITLLDVVESGEPGCTGLRCCPAESWRVVLSPRASSPPEEWGSYSPGGVPGTEHRELLAFRELGWCGLVTVLLTSSCPSVGHSGHGARASELRPKMFPKASWAPNPGVLEVTRLWEFLQGAF